jgi:hypothetical protein
MKQIERNAISTKIYGEIAWYHEIENNSPNIYVIIRPFIAILACLASGYAAICMFIISWNKNVQQCFQQN